MEYFKIILSVTLLIFVFFSKLLVGRSIGKPEWIQASFELPISLFFLSVSFLFAFTITSANEKNNGLVWCLVFLTIALPLIFSWRQCQKQFDIGRRIWMVLLFLNLLVSVSGLFVAINLLVTKDMKANSSEIRTPKKDTLLNPTRNVKSIN